MQTLSVIPPERDRSQWLGGADIAAVLGISPWTTPLQLWEAKTRPGAAQVAATGVKRRGVRWEGAVAEMLVDELQTRGHAVEIVASNVRYQDAEHAFMAAEIDFEVRLDGEKEVTNVELKTVHPFKLHLWGVTGSDNLPLHYLAQATWGLGVTRRRHGMVAALFGADELRSYPVEADAETIGAIRARGLAFWRDHVLRRLPPAPTTLEDLARLFPREGDTPALMADKELTAKVLRLRAVLAEAKARELEAQALEFDVKRAMGDHGELLLASGARAVDWKQRSGSYIDETALKKAHPAIAREFTRRWEARVFTVRSFDAKECER
ncbi:YqaJ viral recombinase family nuclease [Azohydromonas australica]|uniref:YqaJ viral recombinase family nuclease n=1 Tax=Azohydromonas australica TaxID=364039 RepID=UPI00041281FB|nr:YqaJ viral recombinase family protein [Azohydromonas australica]